MTLAQHRTFGPAQMVFVMFALVGYGIAELAMLE
jgi:hypothetical protein